MIKLTPTEEATLIAALDGNSAPNVAHPGSATWKSLAALGLCVDGPGIRRYKRRLLTQAGHLLAQSLKREREATRRHDCPECGAVADIRHTPGCPETLKGYCPEPER